MKWLVIVLSLLCLNARAQFNFTDLAFLSGIGPNNVLGTGATNSGVTEYPLGDAANHTNLAGFFIAQQSGTCSRAEVQMRRVGSPGDLSVQVWTYDALNDIPDTPIGSPSDTVLSSSILTTNYQTITFTNMSGALTSGTAYCFVMYNSAVIDGGNTMWVDVGQIVPTSHVSTWSRTFYAGSDFWSRAVELEQQFVFTIYK